MSRNLAHNHPIKGRHAETAEEQMPLIPTITLDPPQASSSQVSDPIMISSPLSSLASSPPPWASSSAGRVSPSCKTLVKSKRSLKMVKLIESRGYATLRTTLAGLDEEQSRFVVGRSQLNADPNNSVDKAIDQRKIVQLVRVYNMRC